MIATLIRRARSAGSRGVLGPAAAVSAAFLGVNALTYVFTMLAARALAPGSYGELAALLGLLLVGSVPATGLQTAAALHLGGAGRDRPGAAGRVHGAAIAVGLAVTALSGVAAAPASSLLRLPDGAAVFWLVVLLLPHTLVAGYQGMLQGEGRHSRLAVVAVVFGVAKVGGGVVGLLVGRSPAAALAGMTAGALLGALVGWLACGRPGVDRRVRGPVVATLHASGALLGIVVLLNLDVFLARHHLSAAAAGEYAVGAILAKVAFWLPQGVGVVLLTRLADPGKSRRLLTRGLLLLAGVGGVLVLGTAALGSAALPLLGGSAYGDSLGSAAWVFALLGTLLAVAQLLLYSGIASADGRATVAVWTAAVAECVAVELLAAGGRLTPLSLVVTAAAVAVSLVGSGLVARRV